MYLRVFIELRQCRYRASIVFVVTILHLISQITNDSSASIVFELYFALIYYIVSGIIDSTGFYFMGNIHPNGSFNK